MKQKFFTLLLVFIFSWCIFSWKFLWESIKYMLTIPDQTSISHYNTALRLAKNGDFSGALHIIPKIPLEKYDEFRLELYGDLEYVMFSHTGIALSYYYDAKQKATNVNLEQKIAFLENFSSEKDDIKNNQ